MPSQRTPAPVADPKRFDVPQRTLLADAFMTQFIKIGGIGIILTVFGIFLFILIEVLPLFQSAEVDRLATFEVDVQEPLLIGSDTLSELPFIVSRDGDLHVIDLTLERNEEGQLQTAELGPRGMWTLQPELPSAAQVTAITYKPSKQQLLYGLADGQAAVVDVQYQPDFSPSGARTQQVSIETSRTFSFEGAEGPVVSIDYYSTDRRGLAVGIVGTGESGELPTVSVAQFRRRSSLFGAGEWRLGDSFDLSPQLSSAPVNALINSLGDSVIVATDDGHLHYFVIDNGQPQLRQSWQAFSEGRLKSIDWLLGNESLVATAQDGRNAIFSPSVNPQTKQRHYLKTKELDSLPAGATAYAKSLRNRAYLIGSGDHLSLRHATSESIRWEADLDHTPEAIYLGNRYDALMTLAQGKLHLYTLEDPHPEASWKAFFGKVWYEGQPEALYLYQSSSAGAESEPKYSMMNLIWGSFKGTLFAMLFAVPVALLAAMYTSQFLKPEFKKVVKPTMEIMASLPSVVLGFLGALWLAPRIENDVPSLLLIGILVPVSAMLFGFLYSRLPLRLRLFVKPGYEFLFYIPILLLVGWLGWLLGPALEDLIFVVEDPSTATLVADFRLWWTQTTGMGFDQRNSIIVGFMMGFAVIPIIFTITEDAMSNVPSFLTSASLALGASRWQTAWKIVLPTASAGIFSALMIGLGRAVGETMIVVMCSGNTPFFDLPFANPGDGSFPNPFTGMRTLSANIAVELPEAPKGSSHYRILFLGALLLFLLTFFVNTIAEIARHRLRERYKTVG
jgi:phosphate transport system permease protein